MRKTLFAFLQDELFHCFKTRPPKICDKCCLVVCSETCPAGPNHSADCLTLSKLLVRRNTDVEKRFFELAPCLGVIRLIRLKKSGADPVNQLISARDKTFRLAEWEEKIVETLAGSNSLEGRSILASRIAIL
jgi:hypothetical protein